MSSPKSLNKRKVPIHITVSLENSKWLEKKIAEEDSVFFGNKSLLADHCITCYRTEEDKDG